MPTSPADAPADTRRQALAALRDAPNPFLFTVGSADECRHFDVPELSEGHRRDLKALCEQFHSPKQGSQMFPVVGDLGTGKTHLLTTLQAELRDETLFIVADHFTNEQEPIDFFLWQVVGYLLSKGGSGARTLQSLAARLTARQVAQTLGRMSPPQRLELAPAHGGWERLKLRLGAQSAVGPRLAAVERLLGVCDSERVADLSGTCNLAGIDPARLQAAVENHLAATESRDAAGWLRQKFYAGLSRLALLNDPQAVEDFLTGGYADAPEHVAGAGATSRRLLTVLLEAFAALSVPVVLAFDQLEDFLWNKANPDLERAVQGAFCQGLVTLVNSVPGLCVLFFAERGLWNDVLSTQPKYVTDRICKPFTVPGGPPRDRISLSTRLTRENVEAIVRRRVRPVLPSTADAESLPPTFPFSDADIQKAVQADNPRACLRHLSDQYTKLVFRNRSRKRRASSSTGVSRAAGTRCDSRP